MVGNRLNILPRMNRSLSSLRKILHVAVFLILVVGTGINSYTQNLINTGNINNTGIIKVKNQVSGLPPVLNGTFEYSGSNQTVVPVQYKILALTGTGTKTSSAGSFTVTDSVRLSTGIVFRIDSSSVLVLNGTLDENGYLLGRIQKSVDLSGGTNTSAFGNIGATISWAGNAPGMTTVTRTSGIALAGNGHESIKRYYDINPTTNTGLNADFVFKYSPNEINGQNPANLELWKSTDGGATWIYADGVGDSLAHTITQTGITSFSRWTASDTANFALGLVQTYARIIIKHYVETDGNLLSSSDRTIKPWQITVRQDSMTGPIVASVVSDTAIDITSNTGGTFYLIESDSAGWSHIGYQKDNLAPVSSNSNTVIINAFPPQTTIIRFFTFQNGSIAGTSFGDINANGVKEGGENGLSNWNIRLSKNGVPYDSIITIGDGSYLFNNLGNGTYTVSQELQSGWKQTLPSPATTYTINLQSGQAVTTANFGNYKYGSISGTFYEDMNNNGIKDVGENGMSGWRVRLIKSTTQVDSILTAVDGSYAFSQLLPGIYSVREVLQVGWLTSLPIGGEYTGITIGNDTHFSGINFGQYRSGMVSGMLFYDRNANNTKDVDETGFAGWTINADASTPSNSQTTITQAGGAYAFNSLIPDNYTLSLDIKPNWLGSYPPSTSYSLNVTSGAFLTDKDFGVTAPLDTFKFRTFAVEHLVVPKAISPKKCVGFSFAFNFKNKTGRRATGIHVEFNNTITDFTSFAPFEEAVDLGQNGQDYNFIGADVDTGETIRIDGFSIINPCKVRISKWWWLDGETNISKRKSEGPLTAASLRLFAPLPNGANVRDEVFQKSYILAGGMHIGIARPDQKRNFGWVKITKSLDLARSLMEKYSFHEGTPRGFNVFNNNGKFVGELHSLPPSKQDNRLFAELAALKLNIEASRRGITPLGFGDLIYDESGNPLSGMIIKDIATLADTMMTYWMNQPAGAFMNLDTTVRKLNNAFAGDMDTISFTTHLAIKGLKSLNEVPFLRLPANITPMIQSQVEIGSTELPEEYMLYQNYPNPFNPVTTIEIGLPYKSEVTVKIFDVLGQEVATLVNKQLLDEGIQQIEFNANDLSSGVYFYKVIAERMDDGVHTGYIFTDMKKMMLVR